MRIFTSLLIFFTLAYSVFAEDIKIIELHNQTIDQILLNENSNQDNNDNDVENNIENEKITNSISITEEENIIINEDKVIYNNQAVKELEEIQKRFATNLPNQ